MSVDEKVARLLATGHVEPILEEVRRYRVSGDHGVYDVVVAPTFRMCSCAHARLSEGRGECSHVLAAVEWWRAEGARSDAWQAELEVERRFPIDGYEEALEARRARDRAAGEAAFRSLGL